MPLLDWWPEYGEFDYPEPVGEDNDGPLSPLDPLTGEVAAWQ